ncbi:MAG: MMPL family transporter [Planctomycetota bacterium]
MGGCAVLTFMVSMTMIPILLSFVPLGDRIWMNIRKRFCLSRTPQIADGVVSGNGSNRGGTVTVMEEEEQGISALLDRLWYFITRHRNGILLSTLLVGAVFIFFTLRIQVESDIMASFPENSHIMRDNAFIEKHLMGLLPVEIVADTVNGASILQPNALKNLVNLQQFLYIMPEVTSACAITNYIQRANQFVNGDKPQYYALPETEKESADYLKLASIYGDKYVSTLYANDYTSARTSVRMKQVGSNRYGEIVDSIKEFIKNKLDTKNLSWHITGIVPLMINVQDNILWSEIQSFSLAFLLTFISTAVALKSVKIGLISIIPNLLPITVTIGLMGICGMKLGAATIMIASIALGISVDNTIHIFYRFKKELSIDGDHAKAMRATLQGVGKTALFTSLSAAFGFMVFSFSSFKPVQYFGFLTCVTLLNAIVSDLLISPSCLLLFKPNFR